jgi:hypothetical protein
MEIGEIKKDGYGEQRSEKYSHDYAEVKKVIQTPEVKGTEKVQVKK